MTRTAANAAEENASNQNVKISGMISLLWVMILPVAGGEAADPVVEAGLVR